MKSISIASIVVASLCLFGCTASVDENVGEGEGALVIDDGVADWWSTGIRNGKTELTSPEPGSVSLGYYVNLGNPGGGVSLRTASMCTTAANSGVFSFDYQYDFYHAWFMVGATLDVYTQGAAGTTTVNLLDFYSSMYTGPKSFGGSGSINVQAGDDVCFRVGGKNFDSDSRLQGTLTVSNISL